MKISKLIFLAALLSPALGSSETLESTTEQLVRPVLIRNDHNALLRLTLKTSEAFVQLSRITVEFEGSENLESAQFFFADDKGAFSSGKPFGERLAVADAVEFRGHARLNAGENHFWLSCRVKPGADLSSRVDARVVGLETSAGSVIPKDLTPKVSKRIGIALRRHWDDGIHTYRIPALATSTKGTLLCAYDMRRRDGRDLQEDIDIGLLRSEDGGQTWNAQRVIMDMAEHSGMPQELNGVSDPGLIVDPETGEIFCFAVWMQGKPGKHQWRGDGSEPGLEIGKSAQFLMARSTDDGLTWTEPENMTAAWKDPSWILYAPSPQQGIALKDGTLAMPTQGRDAEDRIFSNLLVSRDHGKTWSVSPPASFGNNECQAAVLSDGSIILNCRSTSSVKFRTVMVTRDLGQTWTPHPTNRNTLIEPTCNGSLFRFGDVLLFANPHSQKGRTHHSIQVSFDDGATWPAEHRLLLDEGRGAGYPSLSRIDNEHVGIVYEGSGSQIVFEKIAIGELIKPLEIRTSKEGDRAEVSGGQLSIHSRLGISAAEVRRTGTAWPEDISVRLHLRGLEGFSLIDADRKLALSVLSHGDHQQLLHLWEDGKEGPRLDSSSQLWIEANREGGYFDLKLPNDWFRKNPESIRIEWVDFYRS
ncbi:MAG: sialidase-1 [Verrucomicrobiales bacterium]|jgi:sialidase-1